MNELIKIEDRNGIQTVNARELWTKLESKQEFANWIKNRLEGFCEGQDFTIDKFINGRATQIDYHITIDTAKHISMLERNDIGRMIRQYFIDVEKKAKALEKPKTTIQMIIEMANILAEQERIQEAQNNRLKLVEAKLETSQTNYYTIAGYASLRGKNIDINTANVYGRKASKLSRESDYEIGKISDPRFGVVNTYHADILKMVFGGKYE